MSKFYADSMFGKLARFLRLLGHDTLYRRDETIDDMISESKQSERIIISSSEKVNSLSKKHQTHSIILSSTEISDQLKEILQTLEMTVSFPPTEMRCSLCNGVLSSKEKVEILDKIPEGTAKHYNEFWECDSCSQIFWLGSHWEDIKRTIEEIR